MVGASSRAAVGAHVAFPNVCLLLSVVISYAHPGDAQLLRLHSHRRTHQCPLTLVPGYIVGPSSYRNIPGCASAATCCSQCSADSACTAFTYELSRSECFLKNSTEGRRAGNNGTVSGMPSPPPLAAPTITLKHGPVGQVDPYYKSWNIDASPNRQWDTRNLSDPQLLYLAGASEPGLLRFGGSGNDGLHYGVGRPCPASGRCLNESHFSRLIEFAEAAGSRLVFGINIRTHDAQGRWDPSEFVALLDWAMSKGWGSVFWGFELGNEENGYHPRDAAQDFAVLHQVIVEKYPHNKTRPKIIGPDIMMQSWHDPSSTKAEGYISYLQHFVGNCSLLSVDLYAVTHHEYLEIQEYATTPPPALLLDQAGTMGRAIRAAIRKVAPTVKVWAGEIGPHPGRSPGCDHSSLRWSNFADTFWYVDSMGLKAESGYDMFCRQDFVGIDYGLIDCLDWNPLPDYYAGVIWARTMGTKVLNTSSTNSSTGGIRSYAHCSNLHPNSVTLVLINLDKTDWQNATLEIEADNTGVLLPPTSVAATRWLLTGPYGTNSSVVSLNGKILALNHDLTIPPLPGSNEVFSSSNGRLSIPLIPSESIQFIVLEGIGSVAGCQ